MATYLRTQTTIPNVNGIPEDSITWSFAWKNETQTDPSGQAQGVLDRIHLLMAGIVGASATSGFSFSNNLRPGLAVTKVYDWSLPKPRVPIKEGTHAGINTPVATGFELPYETALVVSYEGARVSGANMRRRRGRWYFGPMQLFSVSDAIFPPTAVIDALLDLFCDTMAPGGPMQLAVYSPYTHWGLAVGERPPEGESPPEIPAALGASFSDVWTVWCDNAWDTQRRRGLEATYRTTRPVQDGAA